MKATCAQCGTELNYEENITPVRCYNCGSEIPKEEVVETEDKPEQDPEGVPAFPQPVTREEIGLPPEGTGEAPKE